MVFEFLIVKDIASQHVEKRFYRMCKTFLCSKKQDLNE